MRILNFFLLHSILLYSISLPMQLSIAHIIGNETDRLSLLAFKSRIHDPLEVMSSWNDTVDHCSWEGVTCGKHHHRVTVLDLSSRGLAGSLSPQVGNLSFLRALFIRNNDFYGDIPQEFGRLFRLEYLSTANNSLVGKIPSNISFCLSLKKLGFGGNHLVGEIPKQFSSLSKLDHFSLEQNKLTGGIPSFLGNLTSLEILTISQNPFGGNIPSTLNQLKNLKKLLFDSCKLTGEFPQSIYNLSNLDVLSMTDNRLSGILPSEIGLMLPNLQLFFFGRNQFSGRIPTSLFNASKLERVDIAENQFFGGVPINVGNLKDLAILNLAANNFGSGKSGDLVFFDSLPNCTNLQVLDLSKNQFGGMLPTTMSNFSNELLFLNFDNNQIYGNIHTEVGNLRKLISLTMAGNLFTGSIPIGIGYLQKLQVLSLSRNKLSGQMPSFLWNMSQLFRLDLSHNTLEGSIASVPYNQNLQILDLSYNKFLGTIPKEVFGISTGLLSIALAHNALDGSIPMELGNLKSLNSLDVSQNKMSGEIPNTIGLCLSLEYIYFQDNFFHGPLPSSLSSLKALQVLDVSQNNISGKIPEELGNLLFLRSLNLSFNKFDGEVPVEGIFRNESAFSISGNENICGGIPKLRLHKCHHQKSKKQGISLALKVMLGVLIFPFLVVLFITFYLRKKKKEKPHSEKLPRDLARVSYADLHNATNRFSSENLVGMGNYGLVFKGIFHHSEVPVAVKVLNLMERGASKSFMTECETLKAVRHRNLLKILTVCSSVDYSGNDFKALIFEYMANGSVESWLHPSSNEHHPRRLNFYQRLNIVIDVASALDYLHNHCETPIIHCDLKPSNVLLDEDLTAHVGDFGLAKFLSKTRNADETNNNGTTSSAIRGTVGYIPPEYGMGADVSTQGDVYSYGILLLEMFTGKKATDPMFKDGLSLHEFAKMALPQRAMEIVDLHMLPEETHNKAENLLEEALVSVMSIGIACSMEMAKERMEIKDVVREMYSIRESVVQVG